MVGSTGLSLGKRSGEEIEMDDGPLIWQNSGGSGRGSDNYGAGDARYERKR
ncbi:hypothetical protein C1H46_010059 [Malus baccata]|uniref:Uncharacterized protein n=1 Tax=Malus baccata TaxID=106549 RepID=A0A540MZS1_MALBA|nr:hypothetical protein C1H46_010059 [Malus baccata]